MIISKYKKILAVTLVITSSTMLTVSTLTKHDCYSHNIFSITECGTEQVNSPSLWHWITSYKSSQFHFFQLLELIHVNDANSSQ